MQSAFLCRLNMCASERTRLFVHILRSAETSHQPLEPPADYQGRWKENTTAKPPINGHLANSYRGRISPCFSHHTLSSRRHLPLILTTALLLCEFGPLQEDFAMLGVLSVDVSVIYHPEVWLRKKTRTNQARLVEWGFE